MIPSCLNHRQMTYDWCRSCPNGRDLDCPEYLADLEHFKPNYTRNRSSGAVTHTNEDTVLRTPSESYSIKRKDRIIYPFYQSHQTIKEPKLPKNKAYMIIREWNDRGAI